ncbi:DUF1653 domain-containing protein [soil metagenome]
MQSVTPGKYKHYKGKFYEVIGTVRHSETLEVLVLYKALYESKEFPTDQLWVRPEKMFMEKVLIEGKEVRRFEIVS